MKHSGVSNMFKDSPQPEQLEEAISSWQSPGRGFSRHNKDEKTLIQWLYAYIRLNVKRGRVFDLREVLQTGEADCLGYAKLFTTLGRKYGLDTGVVEIVTDNLGRNVPHTCALVKLTDGGRQFIDFWYGSPDIRHKRLGLRVKNKGIWNTQDAAFTSLKRAEDISYLPDEQVDAITLYIEGNRSLKEGKYALAIEQYTRAIGLYPQNTRLYYNRAIGYEKLGQKVKSEADYACALRDMTAIRRTLAAQLPDAVDLIKLDQHFIPEIDQEIYLLHRGFITGRPLSPDRIALKLAIPREEVEAMLDFVQSIL
jgi:tetratricopeptide (TPR) repeat protein